MGRVQLTLVTGLAVFAMFFGAGNMVFPLHLGVEAGEHLWYALFGFLVTGVGIPLLGMYTVIKSGGNYQQFFSKLSKPVSALVIFFVMALIGPFFGVPRTAIVAFHTLQQFLPNSLNSQLIFSAGYFILVILIIAGSKTVVDSIGRYISPVKISAFLILVLLAIMQPGQSVSTHKSSQELFQYAFTLGYGTMDLLAAFFFAQAAYSSVLYYVTKEQAQDQAYIRKVLEQSCALGSVLIGLIYAGMMIAAHSQAKQLMGVPTEEIIASIANLVFSDFGSKFVCFLVFLASLATAIALIDVLSVYVCESLSFNCLSKNQSLLLCVILSYLMSILGFDQIIKLAMPVLEIIYPALILYCIVVGVRNPLTLIKRVLYSRFEKNSSATSLKIN